MDRKYKVLDIQKWRFQAFLNKNRRIPALSSIILAEYGHFQHLQHDSAISAVMSLISFSGCSLGAAGRPLFEAGLSKYGFAVRLSIHGKVPETIPGKSLSAAACNNSL